MTDTSADLPAEEPFEGEDRSDEALATEHDGLVDRARDTGVGVEDPNIVGDAGPTDTPPGRDPDSVA
jgi:hypothetical protein